MEAVFQQALREALQAVASSAAAPEPRASGRPRALGDIVEDVVGNLLEREGDAFPAMFAEFLATAAAAKERAAARPPGKDSDPEETPLLADLRAAPWEAWRQANVSDHSRRFLKEPASAAGRSPGPDAAEHRENIDRCAVCWQQEAQLRRSRHEGDEQVLSITLPNGEGKRRGTSEDEDSEDFVSHNHSDDEVSTAEGGEDSPISAPEDVTKMSRSMGFPHLLQRMPQVPHDPCKVVSADVLPKASCCRMKVCSGHNFEEQPARFTAGLSMSPHAKEHLVMRWQGRPKVVLVVAKLNDATIGEHVRDIGAWLMSHDVTVVMERNLLASCPGLEAALPGVRTFTAADELEKRIDLVITVGGDGTLTWAVSLFHGAMPPVLSFAAGSLGFLTPFALDGWSKSLAGFVGPRPPPLPLVCRMRLQVRVHPGRRSGLHPQGRSGEERYLSCLNEVLIDRGQSGALCKLEVGVDGERVTLVQGDGLILATPTGSTAYSLAAGGSMVHPAVPAILMTPVNPHSLSFRPAILPDSSVVTITVPLNVRSSAALSVDGKAACQLCPGDHISVAVSAHPVPFICRSSDTQDWFNSVHDALHWNRRSEQK